MDRAADFPTPAIGASAVNKEVNKTSLTTNAVQSTASVENGDGDPIRQPKPGTLPESVKELSEAARSLLKRLLDLDPKVRLKNLRQLQQTAFYMGFNFEHVKAKKVAVKNVFERYFPNQNHIEETSGGQEFASFDQSIFSL